MMNSAERQSLAAIPPILLLGNAIAWAGSQGGLTMGGLPTFALCGVLAFAINWMVFIPSFLFRTERFYDLTGSATYLSLVGVALLSQDAPDRRALLLGALVTIWAGRLGSFLFARITRDGSDRRFDTIKQSFVRFLLAWTLQGLWVLLTLACALAAMLSATPHAPGTFAFIGAAVWGAGFAIEVIADRQKNRFRADPANRGRFICSGLWAWSRHPNYFGEIVLWIGVAIIALPVLRGWQYATLISPIFVYLLITRISGVPMLEERADAKWGEDADYRAYRANTPVLVPRPASHPPVYHDFELVESRGASEVSPQPLGRLRLIGYSLPALVTSITALPMALFVPAFYADDLGVPLATVGIAIALSRLLDVVTDPLIGKLSDQSWLPFGRRKPWMVLGVPLFVLSLWKIFVPGAAPTSTYLFVWSALLYLGFTMIDLPHKAWGAELSTDYDQRSRVTGWREGLSTAGQVGLLAALAWLAAIGIEDAADQLHRVALAAVIALPVLTAVCLSVVPEGTPEGFEHAPRTSLESLALIARNPAFVRMIGCVLFFVSGVAIQGTLHRLVLVDVMGDESRFTTMILIENLATLAGVPLWLAISVRIGKHRALLAAALWLAIWSLPLVLLRAGDTMALIAIIAIRGSSFASILFLANSIAADVIDLDTLASGEQRSGLYFAAWGMVTKLSLALGVLLGTALPAAFGYDPSAATISATTQARLMIVYGAVPAVLMGIGALFLRHFPITRERHDEVRAALEARGALTG